MDEGLENDVQEARLAEVEETATAVTLDWNTAPKSGIVFFVWRPRVVGFTALLRNYYISVALRRKGSGGVPTLKLGLNLFGF